MRRKGNPGFAIDLSPTACYRLGILTAGLFSLILAAAPAMAGEGSPLATREPSDASTLPVLSSTEAPPEPLSGLVEEAVSFSADSSTNFGYGADTDSSSIQKAGPPNPPILGGNNPEFLAVSPQGWGAGGANTSQTNVNSGITYTQRPNSDDPATPTLQLEKTQSGKKQIEKTAAQLDVFPADDPRVKADGRSVVAIAGRITDPTGELIQETAVVTLTASAGTFVGADQDRDRPGFQVLARRGEFTARLQAGLEAQKVKVRAAVDRRDTADVERPFFQPDEGLEAYTQIEFIPNLRPSLVSGMVNLRLGADGTDYWDSYRNFLDPDASGTHLDVDASIFAIGQIGEWQFTGALNSDRPLNQTCDGTTRLFRDAQLCDHPYPVYGDSSTVDYLTPSTDNVYFKLERSAAIRGAEPDYVMWGDYHTPEFSRSSQLFTATDRSLHGFKANYNLGNLQVTGFFSPDVEGFQRDTIVPDGTSGYYFLSRRQVVGGSEKVFIETEELNRPGTVVQREELLRGPDYEIDYSRGTLLFRRPIQATEYDPYGKTLVRRLLVTYQFEGDSDDTRIYGGRVQYNFSQDFGFETWAAASYLKEDNGARDFELYGVDVRVPLGETGEIIGEYARSNASDSVLGDRSGSAYRLEANGTLDNWLRGRAYYRTVEDGFANDSTFSFTPGQTRYGAEVNAQVGDMTQVSLQYDREENFGVAPAVRTSFTDLFNPGFTAQPGSRVDNSLTTIRAGVKQQFDWHGRRGDASVDYVNRDRTDKAGTGFNSDSSQLVSRLNVPLADDLTFRAQNELSLGGNDPIYPNRTTVGLDWKAYPGLTFRLAHQFNDGGVFGDNSITSFDTLLNHNLSKHTSLTGRYSVLGGVNGVIGQGAVGLKHRWNIAPGLHANLGYEHIFGDIFGGSAAGPQFAQPYAVGQSASALGLTSGDTYSVGLEYTDNPDFRASARFEHRDSSRGNNTVFSVAATGNISRELTGLLRYQQASASNQLLDGLGNTRNLKLGLAYRDPDDDTFNALLKYEYRRNPSTIPDTLLLGSGTGSEDHLFSAEAIYAPNWRWEFFGKFAYRQSTTFLADNFTNTSAIALAQARASYQLGYRWDVAAEARWIGQPSANFNEIGLALEAGYHLNSDLRLYGGYSFGSVDDQDFTGYRSRGGPYVGVTLKLNELFGGFGRQQVAPRQQQESLLSSPTGPNFTGFNRPLN